MKFRKQQMIDAIFKAHEVNQKIIAFIDTIVAECGKAKALHMRAVQFRKSCLQQCKEIVPPAEMEEAVFTDEKQTREENIRASYREVWKRHLLRMKSGLQFSVRLYISTRRRLFVR